MGRFVVRNLEPFVKARLERRAKKNGRSLEEEVRTILRHAVAAEETREPLGTAISKLFADVGLKEPLRGFRGKKPRPASF